MLILHQIGQEPTLKWSTGGWWFKEGDGDEMRSDGTKTVYIESELQRDSTWLGMLQLEMCYE